MLRTLAVMSVVLVAVLAGGAVAGAAGPAPPVLQGTPGIAVAGDAHVVATKQPGGSTLVRLVRDRDAKVLRSRFLAGTLGVPVVTFSGDVEGTWAKGRRLLLATSIYDDTSRTTFVALDARTLASLRTFTLRGSFAFDALSPDGRTLYVLHYPGGLSGGIRYVVRSVDLRTGRLEPGAIVDETEPGERMSGVPLTRAWSRKGTWAYTLYNGGTSHAFVHALNTRARTARCIDLPWAGEAQSVLDGARLSVGATGVLTLSRRGGGVLARIDTRTFSVEA